MSTDFYLCAMWKSDVCSYILYVSHAKESVRVVKLGALDRSGTAVKSTSGYLHMKQYQESDYNNLCSESKGKTVTALRPSLSP